MHEIAKQGASGLSSGTKRRQVMFATFRKWQSQYQCDLPVVIVMAVCAILIKGTMVW